MWILYFTSLGVILSSAPKQKRMLVSQWRSHAGARILATIVAVPQRCSADSCVNVVDRESVGREIERRSIAMYNTELGVSYAHHTRVRPAVYGLRTDMGGCKVPKFSGGRIPPDPPISFCTSRSEVRTNVVFMPCPSNGNVLATPL